MGKMTVNQVRQRLGGIVVVVFTRTFEKRYQIASKKIRNDPCFPSQESESATDAFAQAISEHLQSYHAIELLVKESSAEAIVSFFIRYDKMTQFLVSRDQDEQVLMPDDDADFFRQIFLEFWKSGLSM